MDLGDQLMSERQGCQPQAPESWKHGLAGRPQDPPAAEMGGSGRPEFALGSATRVAGPLQWARWYLAF